VVTTGIPGVASDRGWEAGPPVTGLTGLKLQGMPLHHQTVAAAPQAQPPLQGGVGGEGGVGEWVGWCGWAGEGGDEEVQNRGPLVPFGPLLKQAGTKSPHGNILFNGSPRNLPAPPTPLSFPFPSVSSLEMPTPPQLPPAWQWPAGHPLG